METLYHNVLSTAQRELDETALTAVLQAFALQSVCGNDKEPGVQQRERDKDDSMNKDLFCTAWFNAQSHLLKAKNTRSFVHIYAVFVFQMTAQPLEAKRKEDGRDSWEFLDEALHHLIELSTLVDKFCSHLNPKSLYRTLLESSVRIIRWFGYVRDTVASVLHDRQFVMEDALIQDAGLLLPPESLASLTFA